MNSKIYTYKHKHGPLLIFKRDSYDETIDAAFREWMEARGYVYVDCELYVWNDGDTRSYNYIYKYYGIECQDIWETEEMVLGYYTTPDQALLAHEDELKLNNYKDGDDFQYYIEMIPLDKSGTSPYEERLAIIVERDKFQAWETHKALMPLKDRIKLPS
tara:strand:- start:2195 stop:2671 length:477 start_codon:yes stop_codon:yes gene_type:complete